LVRASTLTRAAAHRKKTREGLAQIGRAKGGVSGRERNHVNARQDVPCVEVGVHKVKWWAGENRVVAKEKLHKGEGDYERAWNYSLTKVSRHVFSERQRGKRMDRHTLGRRKKKGKLIYRGYTKNHSVVGARGCQVSLRKKINHGGRKKGCGGGSFPKGAETWKMG